MHLQERAGIHLGRSTASPQTRVGVPEVAQTKVRNDSLPVGLVQQDVFKLDVAVDVALAVQVAQPCQDLSEEEPGDLLCDEMSPS